MANVIVDVLHQKEPIKKKPFFQIKYWLALIAGFFVLETIGVIQFLLVNEDFRLIVQKSLGKFLLIEFPVFLLFDLFYLFLIYLLTPAHFLLIFEIPWIFVLLICHKKRENWSNETTVAMYTGVVGLAILPIILVQLLGFPQIPVITEIIMDYISNDPFFPLDINPIPFIQVYWVILKWIISWGYMIFSIAQLRTGPVRKTYSKALLIVWTSWLAILAVFICVLPVYVFMIPWLM